MRGVMSSPSHYHDLFPSEEDEKKYIRYCDALDFKDLDTIKYMIRNGVIIPDKNDYYGTCVGPMWVSIKLGDLEFVRELTEKYNVVNKYSMIIALENERYDILYYFFELSETIERDLMCGFESNSVLFHRLLKMKDKYEKLKNL